MRLASNQRVSVAIIPCSREKAWDAERAGGPAVGPQPARLAYRSPLFAAALAWAQANADQVLIFSALHGLVDQNDPIPGTYDVTFSRPGDPVIGPDAVRAQAARLGLVDEPRRSLRCALPDDYAERLAEALALPHSHIDNVLRGVPLADLDAMTAICRSA